MKRRQQRGARDQSTQRGDEHGERWRREERRSGQPRRAHDRTIGEGFRPRHETYFLHRFREFSADRASALHHRVALLREVEMAKAKRAIPEGHHTVTPTLSLDDAVQSIAWYKKALGADEISRAVGPDGKILHAVVRIGDSPIMLHDAMGAKGPKALGGSPASLWIYVEDCDALFNRAVAAGGQVRMALGDQFWGDRMGSLSDPHGYTWSVASRKEDLTREEMDRRAAEFFKQF